MLMAETPKIHQFIIDPNQSGKHREYYKKGVGGFGWGIDLGEFRIVIFAPSKHDEPSLHTKPEREWWRDIEKNLFKAQINNRRRPKEHGPAHVHIFNKNKGTECVFELIEAVNPNDSFSLFRPSTHGKTISNYLSKGDRIKAQKLLKEWVPEFIQLWQELYHDTPLKQCVSRVSERNPDCIERVYYDQKSRHVQVSLRDIHTNGIEHMSFENYIKQPVAHLQR